MYRVGRNGTLDRDLLLSHAVKHERETVLDRYFTDIEADLLDAPAAVDGKQLMDQLKLAVRTRR